jgi:hypothetical protein
MSFFQRLSHTLFGDEPEESADAALPVEEHPAELPAPEEPATEPAPVDPHDEAPDRDREPTPSAAPSEPEGYANNAAYLHDELRRMDTLVRAATVRWRHLLGQHKQPQDWGMIKVDHAEVEAYLNAPWQPPGEPPAAIRKALHEIWAAARRQEEGIDARLAATPLAVRQGLRLPELCRRFDLTAFERDVLLVCLLPELDERYRRLIGYLQDDASRNQPTVELVLNLLPAQLYAPDGYAGGERRAAFAPQGRLSRHHLLVMGGEARGDEALSMRSLRLDDRVARYLLGDDQPDHRLHPFLLEGAEDEAPLILDQAAQEALQGLQGWLTRLPRPHAAIFVHGPYGSGRRARAAHLSRHLGTALLVVDIPAALAAALDWGMMVDLAYREARLQGAALFWRGCEALLEERNGKPPLHQHWDILLQRAEREGGLSFLSSETAWEPAGQLRTIPFVHLECHVPDFPTRRRLWRYYLPGAGLTDEEGVAWEAVADELANDFAFTAGQMQDALVSARGIARRRIGGGAEPAGETPALQPRLGVEDIYEGCRRQSSRTLVTLAQRIRPRPELRLEHVILPQANRLQLREVYLRDLHRSRLYSDLAFGRQLRLGKGLVVLFTGTSGTGKTLAAEALASARQVDLYQVDMSAVVSKWVGETEKNINRVFAEVEGANAILFFDEADALFGKRAEVKDAQDRWANMEVNYLLQRIEAYSGTVILASNLRQNIDAAFLRRIDMNVDFPFPAQELRAQIYRQIFPPTVAPPPDEVLDRLAQSFRLAGGGIKNSVVDATFRALHAGRYDETGRIQVTERDLVLATVREYQKMGRPITPEEFSGEYYGWAVEALLDPREDGVAGGTEARNNGGVRRAEVAR